MRSVHRSLLNLLAAVACTALAYIVIVNGLRNPVADETTEYRAYFTDASGLRAGADIRRQGVQVGKVLSVTLIRMDNTNVAEVGIALPKSQQVTTATRLSIKFQNLTGSRYLEVKESKDSDPQPISTIPLSQTTGSFDITSIFTGLAPVLRTLQPADINSLTEKLAIFLDGDGAGAADLLSSIRSIAGQTMDKQHTLSTLIDNISAFAKGLQGNSDKVLRIMAMLDRVVDETMKVRDQFGLTAQHGPNFTAAVNRLLWVAGLREGTDLNAKFDVLRANLYRVPEFFERLPGFYGGTQSLINDPGSELHCTNGTLILPPTVKVLMAGQQVTLCNR